MRLGIFSFFRHGTLRKPGGTAGYARGTGICHHYAGIRGTRRPAAPVLLADGAWTLALEDVSIALGDGSDEWSLKAVLLTWVAAFPVFHQRVNRKTKHLYGVLYRYGLGVDGGAPRLSCKAAKAMRALLD